MILRLHLLDLPQSNNFHILLINTNLCTLFFHSHTISNLCERAKRSHTVGLRDLTTARTSRLNVDFKLDVILPDVSLAIQLVRKCSRKLWMELWHSLFKQKRIENHGGVYEFSPSFMYFSYVRQF